MDNLIIDLVKERKEYLIQEGFKAYCLFTLTGNEFKLANNLNERFEEIVATPLLKISHKSTKGVKTDIVQSMLNGYVFVYLPANADPKEYLTFDLVPFRILGKDNNVGQLEGEDLEYASWVLDNDGLIGLSQAIKVNGLVKIISGPLKSLEGKIVEYSKKNRNCKVEIEFAGRVIDSWLPFEWVVEQKD